MLWRHLLQRHFSIMAKVSLLNSQLIEVTISRLAQQLIENHQHVGEMVLLGMQPRGKFLAERIQAKLKQLEGLTLPLGYIDVTFHRDDFRRRDTPLKASATHVPFLIEDKQVILIDDVLFTGRTVRAAMDAMLTFGRPSKVELLVLIDRKYSRHLPVEPNFVGRSVNSILSQWVKVQWREQGHGEDHIWLADDREAL